MKLRLSGERLCPSGCDPEDDRSLPTGPDATYFEGIYDEGRWNRAAEPDAFEPFQRWHDANRKHYSLTLLFDDGPIVEHGDTAELTTEVTVDHWAAFRVPDVWRLSRLTETWHVQLHRVPLGGWKVSRITVADPIEILPKP